MRWCREDPEPVLSAIFSLWITGTLGLISGGQAAACKLCRASGAMLTDIHIRSASSIYGADPGLAVLAQGGRPLPGSSHVRLGFSLTRHLGSFFCCAQDKGLSLNITSPGPRCTLQATRGRSGRTLSVSPDSSSALGASWVFLLVKSLSMWLVP